MHPVNVVTVNVEHKQQLTLPLYVLNELHLPMIGRDWLQHIRLDWLRRKVYVLQGIVKTKAQFRSNYTSCCARSILCLVESLVR